MRLLNRLLYLGTALFGLFWTIRMSLMGMYGVHFSQWYPVLLLGSLSLILAAFVTKPSRNWSLWLPLFGSAVLAAFFVPAMFEILKAYFQGKVVGGTQLADRIFVVALILTSLGISLAAKMQMRR